MMNELVALFVTLLGRPVGHIERRRLRRGLGLAVHILDDATILISLSRIGVRPSTIECQIVERDLRTAAASMSRQILAYRHTGDDLYPARAGTHHIIRFRAEITPCTPEPPL